MRRISVFILFSALIFLSVSCGIPTIYVPSSGDISIKTESESGKFTVSLSESVLSEMSSGFPYIYFFYTVSSDSQSSAFSSAINLFNTRYCTDTDGSPIDDESSIQAVSTYTTGSGDEAKSYGIYQFSNLVFYEISSLDTITLSLRYDSDKEVLDFCDSEGNIIIGDITRYNGEEFSKSAIESVHSEITDYTNGTYSVKVYALVSCQFNSYSNIYNTKLSNPLLEFKITT